MLRLRGKDLAGSLCFDLYLYAGNIIAATFSGWK
mgnify:CR=1 FL=1